MTHDERLMRLLDRCDYLLGQAGDWPVVIAVVIGAIVIVALYVGGGL